MRPLRGATVEGIRAVLLVSALRPRARVCRARGARDDVELFGSLEEHNDSDDAILALIREGF